VKIEPCPIDRKLRNWGEGMKHRQMIREATMRGNQMAKNPTAEEAIERARALQDSKIEAVRLLAESNQNVTDARERASETEREYARVFNAALTAGWTVEELRKIGFSGRTTTKPRSSRKVDRVKSSSISSATTGTTDHGTPVEDS
jgi:hypothetical protein